MEDRVTTSIQDIGLLDLQRTGLSPSESRAFLDQLQKVLNEAGKSPPAIWERISTSLLKIEHPDPLHQLIYNSTYHNWDVHKLGPPPVWFPKLEEANCTNIGRFMNLKGRTYLGPSYKNPIDSYSAFQKWSAAHPDIYLEHVLEEMSVVFHQRPKCILDTSDEKMPGGIWLPGSVFNVAESCLTPHRKINKTDDSVAIIWRDEGSDDMPVKTLTIKELRAQVNRVANALQIAGFKQGDAIGIDMPMTVYAVISYLAVILAGMVVVSIADSFVASEIATRCRISRAKGIITQDHILRGGKRLPLYSRVVEANAPKALVIPADAKSVSVQLRDGDLSWDQFLKAADKRGRSEMFKAVTVPGEAFCNILFSSGTTGEPKAIPWSHISPLRCGMDGWGHQDIRSGDVIAWPTNLGWMMGPFVVFAALLNGGAMAVYNGSPLGRGYGKFMQDAKVTMQGCVPSLVKSWRHSSCMDGLDWSSLRCFSSTGEASSADDDLWLMSKIAYKGPVLECCGGTELAAAYAGGSFMQPQALAAFSTQSMSNTIVILDDNGNVYPEDQPCIGEVALVAVNFGASSTLLNADHDKVYYKGMPLYKGKRLRRHGDVFERLPGGYYKAHGRSDDTMNLGGIKASAVEIERVCNTANERVLETAAIAIPPLGGGPEQLVIMAVLKDGPTIPLETLRKQFATAISTKLTPLFKVSSVEVVSEFPRTASNKLLRRVLRSQLIARQKESVRSKL
ncbi:protein MpACOS20 [Marchantia polymorpha subsp. ruderalis]|uniref:AMP-dependent synthetase/ligase domain-containing protein n=2 Tax=Marchantia polymorpha TaxID=3197 RepID=A0A176VUG2_MARPO|nr:hypothetical protein AXG93_333s1060 [Marchantia polymorpha subsp. ruderalis]PTQ38090.1 hypothetical protein MARPO_0053s0036 [Marchantia polymorpha]BBN13889.1 hypothetical protein Mp_6g07220 [Marchantia polymorpha subsp. ruderalis]|eukprot:PTQ38090.1 hypothetical protein MARPO_0053s0036 [Marchantia polymorpha]